MECIKSEENNSAVYVQESKDPRILVVRQGDFMGTKNAKTKEREQQWKGRITGKKRGCIFERYARNYKEIVKLGKIRNVEIMPVIIGALGCVEKEIGTWIKKKN